MSGISTHVLDTARGVPARGIPVALEVQSGDSTWMALGSGATDQNGRIAQFLPDGAALEPGVYRLTFQVRDYFTESFHPEISVVFRVRDASSHHHVPLLLSPYGYTTYRGS